MSARELHAQQEALMKHAANKGQGTSNVDTMTSAKKYETELLKLIGEKHTFCSPSDGDGLNGLSSR